MSTNYQRGAKRERDALEYLRGLGYYAERTAGSHGVADIIALKKDHTPMLIQVKSGKGKYSGFPPGDRKYLLQQANTAGAEAYLYWWPYDRKGLRIIPSDEWPK